MNRQLLKIALPVTLLGLGISSPLYAKDFSYNYVELGVADVEVGDSDNDGDYIYGGGAMTLNPDVFIRGSLGSVDFDPGEADVVSLGVGHPMSLSQRSDLVLAVDYSNIDPDRGGSDTDTLTASAMSRTWLTNNIEGNLYGGLAYADYDRGDDSGAVLGAGIRLHVTPQVSVAADFRRSFVGDLDTDGIGISGRVQF